MSENTGSAFDRQVGGDYYKQFKIEPYKFFFENNIPHSKAAIIRRILRYDQQGGKGLQDLQKIQHECDLLKELNGYTHTLENYTAVETLNALFDTKGSVIVCAGCGGELRVVGTIRGRRAVVCNCQSRQLHKEFVKREEE